ncbi:MAG: type VI secretion system baseplate subunit TssF [Bryobacteraceae bacterium]
MKSDLLPYYERELVFIRHLAADFASRYPERAASLGLRPDAVEDPHVERLIEAFAMLTGRIQHKIDDDFPEITEAILGLLYPHYLRPIPPMSVVQFEMDPEQSKASSGYTVPRDSMLFTRPNGGSSCYFRTCYDATLWPLELTSASFARSSGAGLGSAAADVPHVIRLEMRCLGESKFSSLELDRLRFFLGAEPSTAFILYELLFNNVARVILRSMPKSGRPQQTVLSSDSIREAGFGRNDGMLPYSERSFLGYRLLQEYFSFPQKFLFFDLAGLDKSTRAGFDERFEILILLSDFDRKDLIPLLQQAVTAESFHLGCAPVVNLFERCAEPIRLSQARAEYRVIPDIHSEAATEVYSVDRVVATMPSTEELQEYQPFYSLRHTWGVPRGQAYWHSTRRPSGRKGDKGTEVYLSLLDLDFRPDLPPVETLTVHVTCTNRDRVEKTPAGRSFGELEMESSTLLRIRFLLKPTPALRAPSRRALQWALISHLGLNYLSIVDGGTEALQEILRLYDFSDDPAVRAQIAGITRVASEPKIARIISENGVVFARGIRVSAEFDEEQYVGSGVFLFGSVLEKFFGLYSAVNSFSQLSIASRQRKGELKTWPPRAGEQIVL